MDNFNIYSTGKKKTSISRVFFKNGNGKFIINNLNINKYCKNSEYRKFIINQPFYILNIDNNSFDILITVKGGGIFSQLHAIRHGISKVLFLYNKEYRILLKKMNFLTRDSRKVERKKVGYKKSRKKPQFSKR